LLAVYIVKIQHKQYKLWVQSRRDTCDLNSPFLSIVRKISNRGMPAEDVASCLEKYSKKGLTPESHTNKVVEGAHLKYLMY